MTSPDQPASIQALERERERVIALVSRSFANDALSMDELETRLELAYRATSVAEIRALASDLTDPDAPGAPTVRPAAPPSQSVRKRMVSFMANRVRRGVWIPPQKLDLIAVMSETTLDLREAQIPAGVTAIRINAVMATVRIIVPPHVHVITETIPIMASVSEGTDRGPMPPHGAPVVRITGWAVMAEVVVRREEIES